MKRTKRWILTALLLVLPAHARADQLEVPAYTPVPPCIDTSGNPVVGTVVAVTGDVAIASPLCPPAPAECGAALHAGQFVTTGADAQVALLSEGRYLQLGGNSRVAVDAAADGATRIAVETGSARVIDVGQAPGPALTVATPALETRNPGADVVASATDGSSICSYGDAIEVRQDGRVTTVPPGSCMRIAPGARPRAEVVADTAAALPLSIATVDRCEVATGDLAPTDVAAGPPSYLPPTPPPPPPPPYCQGGSCQPTPPPPPVRTIIEQPVLPEPPPD